jgi:hypothetical protein
MRGLVTTLLVCCCAAASSAQAIECLSAPNQSGTGWWSWREIDGRKCWYKKVGPVPPKSEFVWPDQAKEAPSAGDAAQPPSSMPATEGMTSPLPRIEMARVKRVDLTAVNFRLGDGRVGLLEGFDLASFRGLGGAWEMPDHTGVPLDTFDARYGRW